MAGSSDTITIVFFILVILWLVSLSFFLFRSRKSELLLGGTEKKGLQDMLDRLLRDLKISQEKIHELTKRLETQEKEGETKLQKVGMLRFNPFADTGGEQSFIVGLFDKKDNGMVLTSLSGRSGTRWYAKQVKQGKGLEFNLSKEEEEVVKKSKSLA